MRRITILISIFLLSTSHAELISLKDRFEGFVHTVAATFHANWRRHFLHDHPFVKNRFRLTHHGNDYNSSDFIYPMILTVGSCLVHRNLKVARSRHNTSIIYVDILNMNYNELPEDKVRNNRITARTACREVLRGVRQKRLFDRSFIEQSSETIHMSWMKENANRTTSNLLVPYADLTEIEKDKDRRAIFISCRLYNDLHLYRYFKTTPVHLLVPSIE